MNESQNSTCDRTTIYRFRSNGEDAVGYVSGGEIFRLRWDEGVRIGRCHREEGSWRVFRDTRFDEKELGSITTAGEVRSLGLFEGGSLGWLEGDGTVIRGGLIFAEEEIGRVDGPHPEPAAAALLLLFVPEEDEAGREMNRRG